MKIPVPKSKWEKFEQKAKKLGFNPNTTLENLIENFIENNEDAENDEDAEDDEENVNPDSRESKPKNKNIEVSTVRKADLERWNEDVDLLVQEHFKTRNNYDTT